jgi:UDP-2,4-diacetamido-2,4,6-trideoxy-beta-L-altropyranose hydrolase
MRCFALAQAWQTAGGEATFVVSQASKELDDRLMSGRFGVIRIQELGGAQPDSDATVHVARSIGAGWIVVDGEHFGADFLTRLHASGFHTLVIDDFARRGFFSASLVLNPNPGAGEREYRDRGVQCQLLLGESYILLRREFTSWTNEKVFPERGNRVLVTMGGSDPENLTPLVVKALASIRGLHTTVVVGPEYQRPHGFNQEVSSRHLVVNSTNMAELMSASDLAVIAAGGTLWELLHMGCAVLSYSRNEVQARVLAVLERSGAVVGLGNAQDFCEDKLIAAVLGLVESRRKREMTSAKGREIVDGLGASRVVQSMREIHP